MANDKIKRFYQVFDARVERSIKVLDERFKDIEPPDPINVRDTKPEPGLNLPRKQ